MPASYFYQQQPYYPDDDDEEDDEEEDDEVDDNEEPVMMHPLQAAAFARAQQQQQQQARQQQAAQQEAIIKQLRQQQARQQLRAQQQQQQQQAQQEAMIRRLFQQQQQQQQAEQQQQRAYQQRQHVKRGGKAGTVPSAVLTSAPAAAAPLCRSCSDAATTIQAAWRGWRLMRHGSVLKQLGAAKQQLQEVRSMFEGFLADNRRNDDAAPAPGLTNQQYLTCQELTTRILLDLDSITCGGATELRALRKNLVAASINMLDGIQAAYSRAVNASMDRQHEEGAAASATVTTQQPERVLVKLVVPGVKTTCEQGIQTDA